MARVLLDTHALVWWVEASEKLSRRARAILEDAGTSVYVSAVCAWELAIKAHIGKFKSRVLVNGFSRQIEEEGFLELPIVIKHAVRAGSLGGFHKDPFDRMLVAQAQIENLPILSSDKALDKYDVRRVW